jgi:GT2 family glycosyltransferase
MPDPALSIVVAARDMPRELPRTILSLSPAMQEGIARDDYVVIVVDNGASRPFDVDRCRATGVDLRVEMLPPEGPSPCRAINHGLSAARGDLVGVMIDGARLVSPGLVAAALGASRLHDRPVIATHSFHLGPDLQPRSITEGYDQEEEDRLLDGVDWTRDGYRLFEISVLAGSSAGGWRAPMSESTALFLTKEMWAELGGYDEEFRCPGGGLSNLDVFARACALQGAQLITLLGEGTFHQVHGGVASNSTVNRWNEFHDEYVRIRGHAFATPENQPLFFGSIEPGTPAAAFELPAPVGVVIVTHDSEETIPRTLDALAAGGGGVLDVVVVDNASSDRSAGLVRPPARSIPSGENLGFGRASNIGYRLVDADVVLFLNPDAVISAEDVLRLAAVLREQPDVGAIGPRIVNEDGREDPHAARRAPTVLAFVMQIVGLAKAFPGSPVFGRFFDHGSGTRDVDCLSGACMMVKREAAGECPFDERFFLFGEDLDLCLAIGRAGWRVRFDDSVTCVHLGGRSMRRAIPRALMEAYRSWVLLLAKTRGPLAGAASWLVAVAASLVQVPLWLAAVLLSAGPRRREAIERAKGSGLVLRWAFGLGRGRGR